MRPRLDPPLRGEEKRISNYEPGIQNFEGIKNFIIYDDP
jgi:hypothetical protein